MPLRRMPLPFKILGSLSWAVPYGPSTLLHPARVRLVTSLQSPETSYFSLNSLCGTCGFLLAKTMLNLLKAYIVFLQLLPVLFVYDLRLPWWDGEAERGWGVTPQPCFRCRRSPCSVSPLWHLMKLKTLRGGPALMPTRLSLLQMKARSSAAAGRVSGWGEGRSFCTPRPLSPRCPLQAAARAARPPHPAPTWGEKRRRPSSAARRITLPAVKRRRARGRVVARRRSALGLGGGGRRRSLRRWLRPWRARPPPGQGTSASRCHVPAPHAWWQTAFFSFFSGTTRLCLQLAVEVFLQQADKGQIPRN